MLLLPVSTPLLRSGEDLAAIIESHGHVQDGDIVVISSKAVATTENAFVDLRTLPPSEEARQWSIKTERSPAFVEAVLRECARMQGRILGAATGALLTEVRPEGLSRGTIVIANAGLDESNAPHGFAIGWPRDPVKSLRVLRNALPKIALLLTDSCVHPRRIGVTAFALAASGIDPLSPQAGRLDLFGKPLHITTEAVADQLAAAANFLMGNAAQSVPAVIIRDHGLRLSDFEGWVPGIHAEEDLFGGLG